LNHTLLEQAILSLLRSKRRFDLILTHSPYGEYTRHRRHEETGRAVASLWQSGRLKASHLWFFAYEDSRRAHLPRAAAAAQRKVELTQQIWRRKYRIITALYGFPEEGFEARTTPKTEAFWCFREKGELDRWIKKGGMVRESVDDV
jgi:hypothetical protein